jgi:2-polyprenyl-3-methyl-5-hydroxy-6-metoxy-1,4-benzoquinol methylase
VIDCVLCGGSFARTGHVRWTKDGYDVVRCPTCSLLFRADLPTQAELDAIYGLAYFKAEADSGGEGYLDYLADEDVHRSAAERRLDALEDAVPPGALLDVGAAAGFFVDEARKRGWDASGIDISAPMVEWGRRTLDVPLEQASIAEARAGEGSLDALTMWDYIEHSLEPADDLRRAHELIRPGGVLALSTGDAATFVARISGSRWHLLTPRHHNFFFTARTLAELLRRTGFEIEHLDHRGSRYPVRYLVHKLRTLVPSRALDAVTGRVVESRLGSIAVPLNLFDIVTVVARRS